MLTGSPMLPRGRAGRDRPPAGEIARPVALVEHLVAGLGVDHGELLQPLGGGHPELVAGPVEVGVVEVGQRGRRAGAAILVRLLFDVARAQRQVDVLLDPRALVVLELRVLREYLRTRFEYPVGATRPTEDAASALIRRRQVADVRG